MKLLIMLQSLSLCLTGYALFGQASSRSLLKWSVGGLASHLSLRATVEVCLMPEPLDSLLLPSSWLVAVVAP
jgi:hypothetical protein